MIDLWAMTVLLYGSALIAYLVAFSRKRQSIEIIGYRLVLAGLAMHTLVIVHRWQEASRPPVANMYESMVLFSWAVIAIGSCLARGSRLGGFSPAVVFVGVALLGTSRLWDGTVHPLLPALKSPWLFWHVASCMLAYGSFGVAWVAGGLYLAAARRRQVEGNRARLEAVDHIGSQAIVFGFFMLAVGIVTGSIWANLAWGSWWSWDPKETWALVTWLVYAIYLHHRLAMKWHPEKLAWFSVFAFPLVVFTYVGVNYLLVGLHSYAG